MEIKGKITKHLQPETGEGRNGQWKKQTFILTTPGEYPDEIAIEIWNEKVSLRPVGSEVVVSVNIKSREYNGRYFTNLTAWKIEGGEIMAGTAKDTEPLPSETPVEGKQDDPPF